MFFILKGGIHGGMGSGMRFRESVRWLWDASRGLRPAVLCVGALWALRASLSILFVWVCKRLVDAATGGGGGDLGGLAALMLAIMLGRLVLSLAGERMSRKAEQGLSDRLRRDIFTSLMTSRWRGGGPLHSGDALNRIGEDVPNVSSVICSGVPSALATACQLAGALYLLSLMDARLALALLLITPTALLLGRGHLRKTRRLTLDVRAGESAVQEHIQESVQHVLLLRSLEHVPRSVARLDSLQSSLMRKVMGYTDFSLFSRGLVRLGLAAGYATAFLWGIHGLRSGAVTFGTMTAFLQLAAQIQNPVVQLARQVPALVRATASAERLSELSGGEAEETGDPAWLGERVGVRFEDVGFAYPEDGRRVFGGLSRDFAPGSATAILGETGIGKTTLMRLILALVSPDSGRVVFYNDRGEEREASPSTRCNLSYVPQGNSLFSGTIRDNLLMGRPDATDDELAGALRAAAADFALGLPEGLDTRCGEGGLGLSEGQAQRIAIARGLLRPGAILLLDEPSSSLDGGTERTLLERLREKARGKTVIVITHREETAAICSSVMRISSST